MLFKRLAPVRGQNALWVGKHHENDQPQFSILSTVKIELHMRCFCSIQRKILTARDGRPIMHKYAAK